MKIIKIASVAVAAMVGIGAAVALAEDCASGVCSLKMKADATCCPVAAKEAVVNTGGLATLIQSKVPLKIFDARSGKYDDGQRIPGAQQLSADADEAVIAKAIPDKNALVVTYCAGLKCPASKALADRLKKLGYSNVIEYPQGIAGWLEAGKAVENEKK